MNAVLKKVLVGLFLRKINCRCDWWHMKNGQNQFLGRFRSYWEWFQGGVPNVATKREVYDLNKYRTRVTTSRTSFVAALE